MHEDTRNELSVAVFFPDGSYSYEKRFVSSEEAVKSFLHHISSVGARIGTTVRVIVTDGGDCTNMEWKYGEGITYPPEVKAAMEARRGRTN